MEAYFVTSREKRGLDNLVPRYPAPSVTESYDSKDLALSDSEHLGATRRTNTLSCRFAILHGYSFGVFHFFLGSAFYTICLHSLTSFRLY